MGDLYLYRIQPVRPAMLLGSTPAEDAVIERHFAYLADLTERGVVLLAGRTLTTDECSFGIAVFRAVDEAAARALVDADPAVSERVMRAELFPFRVALLADDWGI
jgi:uncharacterized protein YciI